MVKIRRFLQSRTGFTLVELMIVVIIVGILAAVAVPLYRRNTRKAMASEALGLAGSVRTAQRVYYAENDAYAGQGDIDKLVTSKDFEDNKYFTDPPSISAGGGAGSTTYTVRVEAPSTTDADGLVITMNQAGAYTVADGGTVIMASD